MFVLWVSIVASLSEACEDGDGGHEDRLLYK
jgi:hypothetical protein